MASKRVLVVDDFEPFRRFLCTALEKVPNLTISAEGADGFEAVEKILQFQPDLLLLDVGLPKLNGIEVARRTAELSPRTKILVISQESSADIVQEAFNAGVCGYIVKTDVGRDLQEAINAVFRGERFVGERFAGHDFAGTAGPQARKGFHHHPVCTTASHAPSPAGMRLSHSLRNLCSSWLWRLCSFR